MVTWYLQFIIWEGKVRRAGTPKLITSRKSTCPATRAMHYGKTDMLEARERLKKLTNRIVLDNIESHKASNSLWW